MARDSARRVHHVRRLTPATFVLRFDRGGLEFEPGQYVNLGLAGSMARREYSVSSGAGDDFLEVLIREVEGGMVSGALRGCEPGDALSVEGPYGHFITDPSVRSSARYLFVGSGTGIAPFRSLVRSYPGIDYLLLHGIRTVAEENGDERFGQRYVSCVSRGEGGGFQGRVTGYLRANPIEPDRLCYLCGNGDMIYEVFALLKDQGVPRDHLFAEVYF